MLIILNIRLTLMLPLIYLASIPLLQRKQSLILYNKDVVLQLFRLKLLIVKSFFKKKSKLLDLRKAFNYIQHKILNRNTRCSFL